MVYLFDLYQILPNSIRKVLFLGFNKNKSMSFTPTKYALQALCCNDLFEDENWNLNCPHSHEPALIRAIYAKKQLVLRPELPGLYKFADWLPINRTLKGAGSPVTYKSEQLAKTLGLKNLYITFSGYWPERGGEMGTGSFKECEAYSVCARKNNSDGVMVVASAGNTARAFARVCSENNIPLLLVVPEDNLNALWFDKPINECVKLVATEKGSDYSDAIHLSNMACKLDDFYPEGGAKNVARRDGMGTTVLSAATFIGQIPDYYFQAVGSGTGAIAAWEANMRLLEDGRFGTHKMKLMLSQNIPFVPMSDAWKSNSRELATIDAEEARKQVEEIHAKVLSNRTPPYCIKGGLFDAMVDAGGEFYNISNEDSFKAGKLFLKQEGIDLDPAAAVATASLIKAVEAGEVDKKKTIMLNITGCGAARFMRDKEISFLKPSMTFPIDPSKELVAEKIHELFQELVIK